MTANLSVRLFPFGHHRSILFDIQPGGSAERGAWIAEPEHREAVKKIKVGDLLRVRLREGLAVSRAPVEMH